MGRRQSSLALVVFALFFFGSVALFFSSGDAADNEGTRERRQQQRQQRQGMVALVLTAPTEKSRLARDAMRQTWLREDVACVCRVERGSMCVCVCVRV